MWFLLPRPLPHPTEANQGQGSQRPALGQPPGPLTQSSSQQECAWATQKLQDWHSHQAHHVAQRQAQALLGTRASCGKEGPASNRPGVFSPHYSRL